ncbi:MAG: endonuclease/exonuclease/phosphatase family protein [Thermomicrobiales bacterium]|nr:endonuclease/exonuclease/phosphatase family protein [Thermomicrobiales bacterium]
MNRAPLTVMTFNIANGLADPLRLAEALALSNADLIALQELAPGQAVAIERMLAERYPHQSLHPLGIPGKGLLSRYPIVGAELIRLQPERPDLRATIRLPSGLATAIVAHPEPPRIGRGSRRRNERTVAHIRALADLAAGDEPTILLGDFNRVDWAASARLLRQAGLRDAWRAAGHGFGATLPLRWATGVERGHLLGGLRLPPLVRVDYVWHTPHFRAEAAWLGEDAGSDHRPLLARLALDE